MILSLATKWRMRCIKSLLARLRVVSWQGPLILSDSLQRHRVVNDAKSTYAGWHAGNVRRNLCVTNKRTF
ncbi:hypothetical protein RSAG8_03963, partial [Rhizoctonia solani AG-8 WAC10335]